MDISIRAGMNYYLLPRRQSTVYPLSPPLRYCLSSIGTSPPHFAEMGFLRELRYKRKACMISAPHLSLSATPSPQGEGFPAVLSHPLNLHLRSGLHFLPLSVIERCFDVLCAEKIPGASVRPDAVTKSQRCRLYLRHELVDGLW